jgi:ribosome-binding ATPase YchF (GTP1/OBG family)
MSLSIGIVGCECRKNHRFQPFDPKSVEAANYPVLHIDPNVGV